MILLPKIWVPQKSPTFQVITEVTDITIIAIQMQSSITLLGNVTTFPVQLVLPGQLQKRDS